MLALPDLGAAPRTLTTAHGDPIAAKIALALAGTAPVFQPRRKVQSIEVDVLQSQLQAWLSVQAALFEFTEPRVHVALGMTNMQDEDRSASSELYTVWLSDEPGALVGGFWLLEGRWKAIEAQVPGLANAALCAIDHGQRHGLPVYLPGHAFDHACHAWWWGEETEEAILDEYLAERGDPEAAPPDDMPTRAWLDKVLPMAVTHPRRKLKAPALERIARRGGVHGEIARLALEIEDVCRSEHRRKSGFEFSSQDDNGFQAVGFAACLRWNSRDPMLRIYDDYANQANECEGCDDAFGWYTMDSAADMPALLKTIERQFAIARLIEKLLPLIATRPRRSA